MTVLDDQPPAAGMPPGPTSGAGHEDGRREPRGLLLWFTSTDHKNVGISYMVSAFVFYLIGGVMALAMRAQLSQPENKIVSTGDYNELFTMHGSIMLFLFLGPFAFGLANYLVPLQAGARDMAFPRLNLFSYWIYITGGIVMLSGFLTSNGAANFGWFAYAPLSDGIRSPGLGGDLWLVALALTGISGILTSVNILATVSTMRAPGMTMFRLPLFTWNMVVTSVMVLMAFPVLTAAAAMLFVDRHFDGHIFDATVIDGVSGMPVLWQHLFWFFGHPEVYILVLPYFGVVTEIFPVFSRRPVFGYRGLVFATVAIGVLSLGVWAHHMYATGAVYLPFFSAVTMLIAVPTGVKFFNWIGTMWGGQIRFDAPMLFAIGFLLMFVLGGVTGVMLASPSLDFHVTDSYFVVAHFHYVLFGGSVFALFAGIYYWFPKFTGKRLNERWGKVHFWLMIIGFNLTFFVQHLLGLQGMPRRVATYRAADGFTTLNAISTVGAMLLGISTLPFLWNVYDTLRRGKPCGGNPWDGQTLEWATPSPPPPGNFVEALPPIRSERPLWDANHPDHRAPRSIFGRKPHRPPSSSTPTQERTAGGPSS